MTEIAARLRGQALDPYGLMKVKNHSDKNSGLNISYRCQDEKCHAKLRILKVNIDSEGIVSKTLISTFMM